MASTPIFYLNINGLKPFFAEAAEGTISAFAVLTDSLNNAPAKASQWVALVRNGWCEGAEHVFEDVKDNAAFNPEQRMLLQAMLNAGLDTPELRKHYVHLFNEEFPKCGNPDAVLNALGFSNPDQQMAVVANRLRVFRAIEPNALCWDKANGLGKIQSVDENSCEVKFEQGEKERTVKLASFIKDEVVIVPGSVMEKLIKKEKVNYSSETDLLSDAKKGLVFWQDVTGNLVKDILIPEFYSVTEFKNLSSASQAVPRWDASRSLLELENRLNLATGSGSAKAGKNAVAPQCDSLLLPDINWDNIRNILSKEIDRMKLAYLKDGHIETAVRWANVVAILCKDSQTCPKITEILKNILDQEIAKNEFGKETDAIKRKCLAAFAEVTDNLPGKQVLPWLQVVKTLLGEDFLIDGTMLMPFRLWTHTDQLLSTKEERKHFHDRVFQDFESGKPTADHYAWLWKTHNADAEKRVRFLADSDLLFKTLHKDLKGNYLKSQRAIHKLLKDDANFQKALMKDGDPVAISNLVRCVKRLPLLDSSERQSVLVKIVRLYPEAREVVEENASTVQEVQTAISSLHSYKLLQEEFDNLVNVLIPANVAAIEEARARGDLSENSEYKYAKEQSRVLGQRRNTMERNLNTCRFIDFATQKIADKVIPGAVVSLQLQDNTEEVITLLGLFDTDIEKGWFSYDSPIGRVLRGHKVGDEVALPSGKDATISKIEKLSDEVLDFLRK